MAKVRLLLVAVLSLSVIVGCAAPAANDATGSSDTPAPQVSAEPTHTPDLGVTPPPAASPGATASEPHAPASETSTEMVATPSFPDSEGHSIALLTAVEMGRHTGFDRIVWRFDGELPAYRVAYVQRPITEDGSGAPINVRGDATLQIILTPASGTDLYGEEVRTIYKGPDRIDGSARGTSVVEEVVLTGDFEATLSWVAGLDRQAPFTVTELSDPTRVVVDIASG